MIVSIGFILFEIVDFCGNEYLYVMLDQYIL